MGVTNSTHSTRPRSRLYSDIPRPDAPVIYTGAFPILTARLSRRSIYNTLLRIQSDFISALTRIFRPSSNQKFPQSLFQVRRYCSNGYNKYRYHFHLHVLQLLLLPNKDQILVHFFLSFFILCYAKTTKSIDWQFFSSSCELKQTQVFWGGSRDPFVSPTPKEFFVFRFLG